VLYTKVKNYDIIIVYYEKNNKGDYNMSKVKQWAENTAEESVDKIILQVKQNLITKETAISDILKVDNLQMIGIDSENVEEVIDNEMAAA
tara:strand:- start:34 stop:303 length:270 start_codon:yes stop_codon:yes gene_type:complete